jgi:lipopolysaccharide transport system permease protein/teichoic acid transport system permease protein
MWTFSHPVVLVLVLWVIFHFVFKVQPKNNVPFLVWLATGMAAWFVFADSVNGASSSVVANSNLVKRTLFPAQVLPVVKVVASMATHFIFLLVVLSLLLYEGMSISGYFLQFIYYLFCEVVLALGVGWAVSAFQVYVRDTQPIVDVTLRMGFWVTPIFWDIDMFPYRIQWVLKLNPMFYVVQGYRESFIYFCPFWYHPLQTVYFWTVAVSVFCGSIWVFRRLSPHFAEVL